MRSLRWVGLLSSLLIVGVLVGLMAPLGAEAGTPTLVIDGVTLTVANGRLQQAGPGCGSDNFINGTINGCYAIVGTNVANTDAQRTNTVRIGNWYVGDVNSGNQARVLINDVSPGTENIKLTGVTFTSATNVTNNATAPASPTNIPCPIVNGVAGTGCHVVHIVLTNTFNAQSVPQTAGIFPWQIAAMGQFDPFGSENVINDKFRLAGQACFNASPCTPRAINPTCDTLNTCSNGQPPNNLGTINTGVIASGGNGVTRYLQLPAVTQTAVNIDDNTSTVNDTCNTGSGRCQPTVKLDYEIWVKGLDFLFLTDSVSGCGGPCNPVKETTKLLQCGDEITPGTLIYKCAKEINEGLQRDLDEAIALGGVAAQTCEGTCIIIFGRGTPAGDASGETFHFTTSGDGVCCTFDLTLNSAGEGWKVFSNLTPDTNPVLGERFFTIPPPYPTKNNGRLWSTDQIACTSAEGITGTTYEVEAEGNNNSNKISLTIPTLALNDISFCEWHFH